MPSPAAASPGIPLSPPVLIAKLVKEQHLSASFFTHRASLSPFFSSRIQFPPPVRTLSLRGTHCSILFVAAVWEQLWTDRAVPTSWDSLGSLSQHTYTRCTCWEERRACSAGPELASGSERPFNPPRRDLCLVESGSAAPSHDRSEPAP